MDIDLSVGNGLLLSWELIIIRWKTMKHAINQIVVTGNCEESSYAKKSHLLTLHYFFLLAQACP